MRFQNIYHVISRVYKQEGLGGVTVRVLKRLKTSFSGTTPITNLAVFSKKDVIGYYNFVTLENAGTISGNLQNNEKNVINWLIPDFGIGSGGHLNIFRFVQYLEKNGFKNNICLVGDHRHKSTDKAKELINKHFFELKAEVFFGIDDLPPAEFSFATGWTTAYYLNAFSKTKHKFYFVQDFEPYFYANGSEYSFAEETYKLGFVGVCAGNWLANKLSADYGMKTFSLSFSYDRDLYSPRPKTEVTNSKKRIFCYFRPPTIRRGLETALLALDIVGRRNPNVEFIFAGWDMDDYKFEHDFVNAGLLAVEELPEIYSNCDIALVLSFTNLSLLPLEIMACGCVVVSNEGDNVEWLLNKDNAVISSPAPMQLAENICKLLNEPNELLSLRQRGMDFASSTSWEKEGNKLVEILKGVSN
ncbi:glycosyltransferase family 4 protein [Buttiauxella sp. WJP83]|uniref:glycosyltransferase family 4 protein n=1 Tax=Buttiauxella sp. WJP83 TaxID=2986951 RepID=UPI0022DE4B1C|nr:glycosyltransferase family 4 protein [Buttiauxella sp. WJP83]WBM72085.1 glycosyltransferase family 4 protein [Buttiauxella sp. WJP83]